MNNPVKNLYWISWTSASGLMSYLPNDDVLGCWCSGRSFFGKTDIICAYVVANSENAAQYIVRKDWPDADAWRFCERKSADILESMLDVSPGKKERFQLNDWMRKRVVRYLKSIRVSEDHENQNAIKKRIEYISNLTCQCEQSMQPANMAYMLAMKTAFIEESGMKEEFIVYEKDIKNELERRASRIESDKNIS